MSQIDDAQEWAEKTSEYEEPDRAVRRGIGAIANPPFNREAEPENKPGVPSQYSIYGGGYAAATDTVKRLPAGVYNIERDERCVYVVPALPPSGLILELPEMRSEEVIRMVDSFWGSEKDYKEGNEFIIGGAAYKAGIMMYGSPGNGKTCTIKLVANKLVDRGGTVFFASGHPAMTMDWLISFAHIEKDRKSIVVLEDIDSLIDNFGESGYLEMLDSAKTIDNVLFIATTNYPEKLDPRIYSRPGRLSHVIKIGLPTAKTREAYLKAILKNHRDVDYIVDNTKGFTIDHLNSLICGVYREKKDLSLEIERLRLMFRVPKSGSETEIGFNN